MRYVFVSLILLCALAAEAVPQKTAPRKIPCKTPEIAASCYWTRGRLAVYNGEPAWRLWKIGTTRILGIYSGPSTYPPPTDRESEMPEFPSNLDRVYEADYKHRVALKDPFTAFPSTAFGDFEVCPLEPEHPGWMQSACIESAKNIVLQNYMPRY